MSCENLNNILVQCKLEYMVGWASMERVALLGNSPHCPSFSRVSSSFVVVSTIAIAYVLAADHSGALRSLRRGCNVLHHFSSDSSWIWLVGVHEGISR